MELDGYECAMLDTLLEALSATGCLTATQLDNLFDGDEDLTLFIADILLSEGLALEAGYAQGSKLPLLLNIEKKGRIFLASGGFNARYHMPATQQASSKFSLKKYFSIAFAFPFNLIFR